MNARPPPEEPFATALHAAGASLPEPAGGAVAPALTPALARSPLRAAIRAATRTPEPEQMSALVAEAASADDEAARAQALALELARRVRSRRRGAGRAGLVQALLHEFSLGSREGVALMCLAEALLRIPDRATRDALIRDKIADGHWQQHLGHSPSIVVNAAAWGLVVSGRLVAAHGDTGLPATLRRLVARGGEPLVRGGVDFALRLLGERFVAAETIEAALANARRREAAGFVHSYDMLGEAALTAEEAARYLAAYEHAIEAIGRCSGGRGVVDGPGISVKLSALHPRYARAQLGRLRAELLPRVLRLATLARRHELGFNLDAEEADRLELSLEVLEALCEAPALAGWPGIGIAVQAYQKRSPAVVDYLVDLARRTGHRLMVRLVKGAYWDAEIKRAQQDGLDDYPVHTRKAHTDVAYLACARRLLAAPDAVYPQFATHNAQTVAAIRTFAGTDDDGARYEFQCLHGMGEPLYEPLVGRRRGPRARCRIYAPVGTHETLLAYLVRRLLENGANTSFVHRVGDPDVALERLVEDPVHTLRETAAAEGRIGAPHPSIPLPPALYGTARANSLGADLADETTLEALAQAFAAAAARSFSAEPLLGDGTGALGAAAPSAARRWQAVVNPADPNDEVGQVREAAADEVRHALAVAAQAAPGWAATAPVERAACLRRAADALEGRRIELVPLIVREAGRTCANAIAEIREAVDFMRYYAALVERDFANATHLPLGPVACISPWNFPLSIFTGQVAAALAAGNVVLAKPAEQTPLVAALAVQVLHAAGVPRAALQLVPGRGETVGAALVADARVNGVLFTGSTEVARMLQRTLAGRLGTRGRPVALVAETGGRNAMVVDSTALVEQAVADIVTSAFDSAGQRCSALRLLCVQDEIADRLLAMLRGAMRELAVGDPRALATDVGPLIDAAARAAVEAHVQSMRARGRPVWRPTDEAPAASPAAARGHHVAPTIVELGTAAELEREVFGPVLHVLRYRRERLAQTLAAVEASGYALTLGVQTRIDATVAQVVGGTRAGNVYVNRNIVGATVGVQPFGGEGLSGTGPKAGGPLYLLRLLAGCPGDAARRAVAQAGTPPPHPPLRALPAPEERAGTNAARAGEALAALRRFAVQHGMAMLVAQCDRAAAVSPTCPWLALPGPTGEANLYAVRARAAVLCLAEGAGADADRLAQLAAVLAVGGRAVWPADAAALHARLPATVQRQIALAADWRAPDVAFDAVLCHGSPESWLAVAAALAERPGPVVGLTGLAPGDADIPLERLVVERSLCINTAAAGGNASLMTVG